jgi:V/A-type H+-transporting ATPase subunit I
MAVAQMAKVMVVSHRSQASELLEALQAEGICQFLNAEQAMVCKDMPELVTEGKRPKDIETLLNRLQKSIEFLKNFRDVKEGLASVLSPRTVVDAKSYNEVISKGAKILQIIGQTEQAEQSIEKTKSEIENLNTTLQTLEPFRALETPVEDITPSRKTTCFAGLLPARHFDDVLIGLTELTAAVQNISTAENKTACIIVCLKEQADEVQKLLRCAEFEQVTFEQVTFEPMTGKVADLLKQQTDKLHYAEEQLQVHYKRAAMLSENKLKLEILYDHYQNLLNREQAKDTAPATQHTVILEGWVKKHDYKHLERVVSRFDAASVTRIEPSEGEEIPVEIENKKPWRPFEAITRLYGMPVSKGIDPTACLAPFFALFFGLCLADVGYGLVMAAVMVWLLYKMQGDKKFLWLFLICASFTILLGAITGGCFGDAVPRFIPALNPLREKLMLFDPLEQPMVLFVLAIILGYIQIMTGLLIAFAHNIKQKDYIAAVCDQLTWLVMINSIVVFGLSKSGMVPPQAGRIFGKLALLPAVVILLFSQRQGGWAGRIGMGAYNLFSAVFYLGDVLSYLRLMALCMVGGGIAMSINIIAKISLDIPYGLGIMAMILVLVLGHALNLVLSALGAFVHTLRLQYVEFFTKFFVGGGRLFEPLRKDYKHIYIK